MLSLSVIVPAYNTEKYIGRCLDSIISQKYYDYEIIIVNDGSTDLTSDVCENYVKTHPHIKLFCKLNGGTSSALNDGLKYAHGKYVYFLDSDDTMAENAIKLASEKFDFYDIVKFTDYAYRNEKTGQVSYEKCIIKYERLEHKDQVEKFILETRTYSNCFFRRDLIVSKSIYFNEEIQIGEDDEWQQRMVLASSSIGYVYAASYIYTIYRKDSLMNSLDINKIINAFNNYNNQYRYYSAVYSGIGKKLLIRRVIGDFLYFFSMLKDLGSFKSKRKIIKINSQLSAVLYLKKLYPILMRLYLLFLPYGISFNYIIQKMLNPNYKKSK